MPPKARRVPVVRAYQSPMNAKRWLCALACGHEVWKTASRRPATAYTYCDCKAQG